MLIQIICILLLIPAFLVCAYYWFLALYALFRKRKKGLIEQEPAHTFAIVIPAHNEEDVLYETLKSCSELDYPKDKYKVFVVADNCSDHTAEIAIKNGVACFERHDEVNKGKGFALAWAFERILSEDHDTVVVLDADCRIDSQALTVFNHYLSKGNKVLQVNYVVSNPDVSSMSYAIAVGSFIENELFYMPKDKLGLSVFLQGTGMVIHREVLNKYPWEAHSIVEDIEYAINLIKNGVQIRFIPEVKVASEFPAQNDQLYVQRARWAGGNLRFGRKHALKMIWQGLINRQWRIADAGWTFIVLSRPLVLLELITATAFALLCVWLAPGSFSTILLFLAFILTILQGIYFMLGIILLGFNLSRLKLLISTPFVVAKLIAISVMSLFRSEKNDWVRTPR